MPVGAHSTGRVANAGGISSTPLAFLTEPLGGIDDIHLHPAPPRSARLAFTLGY